MSVRETLQQRHTVRHFTDQPVDRDILRQCINAGRLAPSAENVQPWRYIVVDDTEVKSRLVSKAFSGVYRPTRWAAKAPVLIVVCGKLDIIANRLGKQITGISYYLIDIGISGEHVVLQAEELGLGSCWIGWFSSRGAAKALKLPRSWRPTAILAMGYPADSQPRPREKRSMDEICYFNRVE
ncbi:MAG: nitroreductase family protein [candidate division KSB1 bacterium]|nr:nitroreductase family protein [candidate division KSB1 bacterium]